METLILYVDDSEDSHEAESQIRRLVDQCGYYTLEVLTYCEDFHTCEYDLPYLRTESGVIFGFQLTDFIDRHRE